MAKDFSIGVAVRADGFDWTRLERAREEWRVQTGGGIAISGHGEGDGTKANAEGGTRASEMNEEEARSAVRQVFTQAHGDFTLCVESAAVMFRYLTLPTADPKEVAEMVSLQLDKVLPLPVEEMAVAVEPLFVDEVNTVVLACAAPVALLDAAVERLGVARHRVERVDVAALAGIRLLAGMPDWRLSPREVVLWVEGAALTLMVLDDGVPVAIRSIEGEAGEVLRAVRLALLAVEAERDVRPVSRISLVMPEAAAEAYRADLAEAFQCAVRCVPCDAVGAFSNGAALRSAEQNRFDLTPMPWREVKANRSFRRKLWRITSIAAGVWVLLTAVLFGGPHVMEYRIKHMEKSIVELEAKTHPVKELRDRVRLIQSYMQRDFSALETLREVSSLMPEDINQIKLTELRYRYDAKDQLLTLRAVAPSPQHVYAFKQSVDQSELFSKSELTSGPTVNRAGVAEFELKIRFRGYQEATR